MKTHALNTERPLRLEMVDPVSVTVPGLAISVSEIVRRQSLGLPVGCGVHGITDIPEGMSFEAARREALYWIQRDAAAKAAAEVPPAEVPPVEAPPTE